MVECRGAAGFLESAELDWSLVPKTMRIWRRGHIGIQHKEFLEANNVSHKPWCAPNPGANANPRQLYV